MTLEEKETIIEMWPYPWKELMDLKRRVRDERLKYREHIDTEPARIQREYEEALDRMLAHGKTIC